MTISDIITTNYPVTPTELAYLLDLFASQDLTSLTYWDIVQLTNTYIQAKVLTDIS
jgi:hypothetical protein